MIGPTASPRKQSASLKGIEVVAPALDEPRLHVTVLRLSSRELGDARLGPDEAAVPGQERASDANRVSGAVAAISE